MKPTNLRIMYSIVVFITIFGLYIRVIESEEHTDISCVDTSTNVGVGYSNSNTIVIKDEYHYWYEGDCFICDLDAPRFCAALARVLNHTI